MVEWPKVLVLESDSCTGLFRGVGSNRTEDLVFEHPMCLSSVSRAGVSSLMCQERASRPSVAFSLFLRLTRERQAEKFSLGFAVNRNRIWVVAAKEVRSGGGKKEVETFGLRCLQNRGGGWDSNPSFFHHPGCAVLGPAQKQKY